MMKFSSPVFFSFGFLAVLVIAVQFLIGKDNIIASRGCNCLISQAAASADDEAEVAAAVNQLRDSMIQAQTGRITSLADPELSFGHSNGVIQSREEFVSTVASGEENFKRIELSNRRLKIVGDTAVERHHFSADIVLGGQMRTFELEIVQVWKKSDRWRLAVRQAFKT